MWLLVALGCGEGEGLQRATEAPSETGAPTETDTPTGTPTDTPTEVMPALTLTVDGLPVDALTLPPARAGWAPTRLELTLTAVGDLVLSDALTGDPRISWELAPPASLADGGSATAVLQLAPDAEGTAVSAWTAAGRTLEITGEVGPPIPMVFAGPYGRYATSEDYGATWADQQLEVDDGDGHSEGLVRGCSFGAGRFVCVGGDATGLYSVSEDGLSWTTPQVGTRGWIADVAWGGDRFVAVGGAGNLAWSPDGLVWTETAQDYATHLRAVAYGDGRWVAVGGDRRAVTTDGVSWSSDLKGLPSIERIAWGNGVFVGVGSAGGVAVSADGVTWTETVVGTTSRYGIAFGGGQFLIAGWPDGTWSSPDGLAWTKVSDGWVNVLGYADGQFYATSWVDHLWRSPDGVVWEEVKGSSDPQLSGFNDFAFGG